MNANKRKTHVMKMNVRFNFGKYKSVLLREVILLDPEYVRWCINNVARFRISTPAKLILEECNMPESSPFDDDAYYDHMDIW